VFLFARIERSPRWLRLGALATVFLAATTSAALLGPLDNPALIVAGTVPLDPIPIVIDDEPEHIEPPPPVETAGRRGRRGGVPVFSNPGQRGLWPPNGKAPGPALAYAGTVDNSGGLQFVLILGSDARSGDPAAARADSIHVLALDPVARRGTIVGIPRDSYVDVPGYGKRKINEALKLGGPALSVRTVRNLTGMPITYYLLTAFEGFRDIVADLGGVDAYVPYDMNDDPSGAYFQRGWHRMDGGRALAFTRNRHVPAGDFARSENQGRLMLDVLKKLRAETSTRDQIEMWMRILVRRVRLDMSFEEAVRLGVLARVTAASNVVNVVAPGTTGNAGGASVVFLGDQARALFEDVRADAVAGGSYPKFGPGPPPDDSPPEPEPSPSPTLGPLPLP